MNELVLKNIWDLIDFDNFQLLLKVEFQLRTTYVIFKMMK